MRKHSKLSKGIAPYKTKKIPGAKGKRMALHRWVWTQANGPIPTGMHVHHKNHDHKDNRLENLELITPSQHSKIHGRQSKKTTWGRGPTLDTTYDKCTECGTSERRHRGKGLCERCYFRAHKLAWRRARGSRPLGGWSLDHERCTECGTTERAHEANGLCKWCYHKHYARAWRQRNLAHYRAYSREFQKAKRVSRQRTTPPMTLSKPRGE